MSRHSRTLEPGEQARTTELLRGSTHPVSINWPVPWHRRVVDPIWALPGPVPAALGSVFPLHSRSPQPFSPFLHCGPGPFSLSTLSQEPTETSTSQPTDRVAVLNQSNPSCWAQQPIAGRGNVPQTAEWPMRVARGKTAFSDPTRPVCSALSPTAGCTADGALSLWAETW